MGGKKKYIEMLGSFTEPFYRNIVLTCRSSRSADTDDFRSRR